MRLSNPAIAFAATLLALAAFQPRSFAKDITVPKGTDVVLAFDQSLSSKHAKVGDQVKLHVANDVMVGGKPVIHAGTPVNGVITKVEKRKRFGINAKMLISLDPVHSAGGKMISLEPKGKGHAVGEKTGEAAAASGGGAFVLGPVGLVGGYFVVGKNVEVKPGDHLVSEVASDTVVKI